jgi:hypothetical protein
MLTAPPTSTRPQHLVALQAATARRSARADIKRNLASAPSRAEALERCAVLLLDPPDDALGMTLGTLLTACYKIGDVEARRLLDRMRPSVSETVRVEHLTFKRSLELAGVLRGLR